MEPSIHPPVPILYEDNHLLVVEKPVNIPTQEDESKDLDLMRMLKQYIKEKYKKPGNVFLGLVHRLDRPVGGVMVFARTSKAASRLSEAIRNREVKKHYLAVVHGSLPKEQDRLIHYLIKDSRRNWVTAFTRPQDGAKKAILDYHVLGQKKQLSLVHIQLETGRPHQIRVQMASSRCPLYGDQKYGSELNRPGQQLALWSVKMELTHPTLKTPMAFISQPPREFPWNLWEEDLIRRCLVH